MLGEKTLVHVINYVFQPLLAGGWQLLVLKGSRFPGEAWPGELQLRTNQASPVLGHQHYKIDYSPPTVTNVEALRCLNHHSNIKPIHGQKEVAQNLWRT